MWNKFMIIIDGKSNNDNLIDIALGMFFITLGINAIFITSYRLPIVLYVINVVMSIVGLAYILIATLDYKNLMVKYIVEVSAFAILIINALLATVGINDHADPISCAMFGIFMFTIKLRREWLEKSGGK